MAYVSKEKKQLVAAELKKIMGKGWKYSLKVVEHKELYLTILEAPIDLSVTLGLDKPERVNGRFFQKEKFCRQFNMHQSIPADFESDYEGEALEFFSLVCEAMNLGNYYNSDPQHDRFDIGHYASLRLGSYEKPFNFSAGLARGEKAELEELIGAGNSKRSIRI